MSRDKWRHRTMRQTLAAIAIAIATTMMATTAEAGDSTWKGGTGSWIVDANWSDGAPNSSSTNAIINGSPPGNSAVGLDRVRAVGTLNIAPGQSLNLFDGARLDISGNALIDGTFMLGSASTAAELQFLGGNRTISGSGSLILENSASGTNRIFVQGQTNNRITFESGLTVQGAGDIGAGISRFTNRGIVEANQPVMLKLNPSNISDAFINEGTLRAVNGATLHFAAASYANTGGMIQAQDASFVELASSATVVGGTLSTLGSGVIRTVQAATKTTVTLNDVALTGLFTLGNGNQLDIKGTLTNSGTLQIASTGGLTDLRIVGDTTIAGNGTIVLMHSTGSRIFADVTNAGASHLTIGAGQTIHGTGNIGAGQSRITNEGTIHADANDALTIQTSLGFANHGQIVVDSGKALIVAGSTSFTQNAANASTEVFGTMTVPNFAIQAGTLTGTGTIVGTVVNTGGSVSPGSSPGTLNISGDYTQGKDGKLTLEFTGTDKGSSYDWLNVSGKATLDGTAVLNFGFTPLVGASFVVLTANAGVSGKFSNIIAPTDWIITDSYGNNSVTLTIAAVPEPETYALMLAGLGFIAWAARHRRAGGLRLAAPAA
jgi:hypothetical protein